MKGYERVRKQKKAKALIINMSKISYINKLLSVYRMSYQSEQASYKQRGWKELSENICFLENSH